MVMLVWLVLMSPCHTAHQLLFPFWPVTLALHLPSSSCSDRFLRQNLTEELNDLRLSKHASHPCFILYRAILQHTSEWLTLDIEALTRVVLFTKY